MSFANDTFTGTDGATLQAHTPDSGGTWTKHAISLADVDIKTNRVYGNGNEGDYYHSASPAAADYDVQADIHVVSNTGYAGVILRWDTAIATGTYYGAGYNQGGTPGWEVFYVKAGSFADFAGGTSAATLTVGNDYTIKLTVRTNTLTLWVNGVQTIQVTDANTGGNNITAAGKAGLYGSAGAATGYHLDNWSATDVAAAATVKPFALLGVG